MQFGISLCHELRSDLLAQKTSTQIFELLRLAPARVSADKQHDIVRACAAAFKETPLPFADIDFAALRKEMYDTKLRARMEAAAAAGVGKEEESESDEDESDLEEGAECALVRSGALSACSTLLLFYSRTHLIHAHT